MAATERYQEKNREKTRERSRAYRKRNTEKVKAKDRRWWAENGEKRRVYNRRAYHKVPPEQMRLQQRRYRGMRNAEDVPALFELQGRVCAICRSPEPNSKCGWFADHDHRTGLVRGVLCQKCNTGLGCLQDSLDLLRSAIAYLEKPPYSQLLKEADFGT